MAKIVGKLPLKGNIFVAYRYKENGLILSYFGSHFSQHLMKLLPLINKTEDEFSNDFANHKVDGGYVDYKGNFYKNTNDAMKVKLQQRNENIRKKLSLIDEQIQTSIVQQKLKKEDILKYFGNLENPNIKSDYAMLKVLLIIYDFQTEDEKNIEGTTYHNSVGFTGVDGQILTSFAKQLEKRFFLSPKQMIIVRKKMRKYAMQIAKLINTQEYSKNDDTPENRFRKHVMNKWYMNAKNLYDVNGNLKLKAENKIYKLKQFILEQIEQVDKYKSQKAWNERNKEKIKLSRELNKEKYKEQTKKTKKNYYEKNKEKQADYAKKYYELNKEKLKKYHADYAKKRKENDPVFKEKEKQHSKNWYYNPENKEKIQKWQQDYMKKNRAALTKYHNEWRWKKEAEKAEKLKSAPNTREWWNEYWKKKRAEW